MGVGWGLGWEKLPPPRRWPHGVYSLTEDADISKVSAESENTHVPGNVKSGMTCRVPEAEGTHTFALCCVHSFPVIPASSPPSAPQAHSAFSLLFSPSAPLVSHCPFFLYQLKVALSTHSLTLLPHSRYSALLADQGPPLPVLLSFISLENPPTPNLL